MPIYLIEFTCWTPPYESEKVSIVERNIAVAQSKSERIHKAYNYTYHDKHLIDAEGVDMLEDEYPMQYLMR